MSEYQRDDQSFSNRIATTVSDVAHSSAETGKEVAAHVASAARCVSDAVDYARQPGRPLDIIATVARKAPLTTLALAFLLGAAFARRR